MARRAVLFDLDNTLHDRDAGVVAFARWQFESLGLSEKGQSLDAWTRRFVELDANGRVWKDRVYERLRGEFGLESEVADLLAVYEARFAQHALSKPSLRPTLEELRVRGWKLGIVTNGRTTLQRSVLAALDIEDLLDTVLISEACGWRKPDPRIFEAALREVGAEAEASWFVGDDPDSDIAGASALGLCTVWMRTGRTRRPVRATRTIKALSELLDVLDP